MATGRIGVTPVLRVRWSKQPTAGTTSLSGLDDNSVALVYDAGYEAVYRNGVLLSRGNDYTATNGTTITLIDATLTGDIIEVFANDLVPLTDAISKGQYNAKGALLSATAASTPAVLPVGANATVLTADSTEATGLKWATPAAGGGITLISTATPSAATTVSFTSIPTTYKILLVKYVALQSASNERFSARLNNESGSIYNWTGSSITGTNTTVTGGSTATTSFGGNNQVSVIPYSQTTDTSDQAQGQFYVYDANLVQSRHQVSWQATGLVSFLTVGQGYADLATSAAISRIDFIRGGSQTITGTFYLYGWS